MRVDTLPDKFKDKKHIQTAFGSVELTDESRKYLESIHPCWEEFYYLKIPFNDEKAESIRSKVRGFYEAITVIAMSRYVVGSILKEI